MECPVTDCPLFPFRGKTHITRKAAEAPSEAIEGTSAAEFTSKQLEGAKVAPGGDFSTVETPLEAPADKHASDEENGGRS